MAGIRELRQWVGYKTKPKIKNSRPVIKSNGKPKLEKIPINPLTGRYAESNNPETWTDFDTAANAIQKYRLEGLGFVFTKESGVTGIDLDDCVQEDGTIDDFALSIIKLMDSYTEYSPSGDGVHILVQGAIPRGFKNGEIEMYDFGRFFTYTGRPVNGYNVDFRNRQEQLDQLWMEIAKEAETEENSQEAPVSTVSMYDQELLDRAMNAENGAKFRELWRGDTGGYDSQSEADSALCHLLAFWTGRDEIGIDRLFRQSGLFREKWDEKHYRDGTTYGQQTIARAIANTMEVYQPRRLASTASANGRGDQAPAVVMQDELFMPSLPETAAIDSELGKEACSWLDAYVDFSRQHSPRGYDGFHETIALWLLSTVASRRLILQLGTKAFFPNLYLALCAHTTLYAKTTTARLAQDVLQAAGLSYLLLPNDMTPQAFINELVLRVRSDYGEMSHEQKKWEELRLAFAGQRGWFYEEFGTKIQVMMRDSGFMAEFRGLLRVFDDNQPSYQYVTMTRRDTVKWPYLALMVNMTPADVRQYAKPGFSLWQDGFWARWAFITPPIGHPLSFGRFPDQPESIPIDLIEPLKHWHNSLGIPTVSIEEVLDDDGNSTGRYEVRRDELQPKSCTLGGGVMDAFYAYHDGLVTLAAEQADDGNTDLIGNYGRFAEKALRIAMLLAGISNENHVELKHWARAQTITESWRANLHTLVDQLTKTDPSHERQLQEKIISLLKRHGPSTAADIGRYIRNVSGPEVDDICRRLIKSGELQVLETTKKGTNRYMVAE